MNEGFEIDWQRSARTGMPEAIFCASKSADQIDAIVRAALHRGEPLLLTRLSPDTAARLSPDVSHALTLNPRAGTARLGTPLPLRASGIGIVAAGTSDLDVAEEAAETLAFMGYHAPIIADVGVAGLWRLMQRLDEIRQFRLIIAMAGMEGALFSVLSGLVSAPIIAVPTSVGYGVASGGTAALHSALASCAPGIVTVNIDNGFGAAAAAIKMIGVFSPSSALSASTAPAA